MSQAEAPNAHRRPLDERLAERPLRADTRGVPEALIKDGPTSIRVERAEERTALLVGALMLKKASEQGQTRVFPRAVDSLIERAAAGLTPRQLMALEIEAYRVVDWMVGGDPSPRDTNEVAQRRDDGVIVYDPDASVAELITRAIDEGFDLKIDYFSRSRGEMNTRRIRPTALEAEVYVQAFCHARKAERVFRLNRITRCIPIHGRPQQPATREALAASDDREPIQISLLED